MVAYCFTGEDTSLSDVTSPLFIHLTGEPISLSDVMPFDLHVQVFLTHLCIGVGTGGGAMGAMAPTTGTRVSLAYTVYL